MVYLTHRFSISSQFQTFHRKPASQIQFGQSKGVDTFQQNHTSPDIREIRIGTPEYEDMMALRQKVLRDPIGLRYTAKDRAEEINDRMFVQYDGSAMIGCFVIRDLGDDKIRIRQLAVHPDYQKKGIGRDLFLFMEKTVRKDYPHAKQIIFNARETAIPFFIKLGYELSKDVPKKDICPHNQWMEKSLKQ